MFGLYDYDEPLYMHQFKEEDAKLIAYLQSLYPHLSIESCHYKEYLRAFYRKQTKELEKEGLDPLLDRPVPIWAQGDKNV